MRALIVFSLLAMLLLAGCKTETPTPPAAPEPVSPQPVAPEPSVPVEDDAETADLEQSIPDDDIAAIEGDMAQIEGMEDDLDPSQFEDSPII